MVTRNQRGSTVIPRRELTKEQKSLIQINRQLAEEKRRGGKEKGRDGTNGKKRASSIETTGETGKGKGQEEI